ncbi:MULTISPECIES: DUF4145 domain-containing protein [unclassified Streptomyces]|uniref:DUF4145 domain-containing protein n=1 Tax=unclassified Streptomyces TaxID=2593676 RepID=UPI0037F9E13E
MSRIYEVVLRHVGWGKGELVQAVFECDGCNRLSLGTGNRVADLGGTARLVISPSDWLPLQVAKQGFADVPETIADMATEAHQCLGINANRAAVALARAVVEATAKERGILRGTLEKKIDKLFDERLIREYVRDAAHEVRFGGNEVAHGDLLAEPMDDGRAREILGLMDEILEEVFQSPARVGRLKLQRLEREQRLKSGATTPSTVTAGPDSGTEVEVTITDVIEPPF